MWLAILRQRGSHAQFDVDGHIVTFAYHDDRELSDRELRRIADAFSITLDQLKELL